MRHFVKISDSNIEGLKTIYSISGKKWPILNINGTKLEADVKMLVDSPKKYKVHYTGNVLDINLGEYYILPKDYTIMTSGDGTPPLNWSFYGYYETAKKWLPLDEYRYYDQLCPYSAGSATTWCTQVYTKTFQVILPINKPTNKFRYLLHYNRWELGHANSRSLDTKIRHHLVPSNILFSIPSFALVIASCIKPISNC